MSYRVFLSSTFSDLKEHRKAVQDGLQLLGAVDVSMEKFGARDQRPAAECERIVKKESDLFVGIYAHRYGFIPEGSKVSISEIEYKAASQAALPRFIYMIDENERVLPAYIDSEENSKKLKAYKEALLKRHICQYFGNADNLAMKVVADIGRHIAVQGATRVGAHIDVQNIGMDSAFVPAIETPDEWNTRRNETYQTRRNVFLTHIIHPSSKPDQEFEVFIYLIRHKSEDFSDIRIAEFFLGPYWANKIFPAVEQNGVIGISTSAYGTFLCVCRVTFNDGTHIYLDRYIDFEMYRTGGA